MDLRRFSTEELHELLDSHNEIVSIINERIAKRKNESILKINNCFIQQIRENVWGIYKIIDIDTSNNEVHYDEILIDYHQLQCYTNETESIEYVTFNEMETFSLEKFEEIKHHLEIYDEAVEKMHKQVYNKILNILEK